MRHAGPVVLMLTMIIAGCGATSDAPEEATGLSVRDDIVELRAQFVPQTLTAEISHLSDGDREALRHLVTAAEARNALQLSLAAQESSRTGEIVRL